MPSSKTEPLQSDHESSSDNEDSTGGFYAMHVGGDGRLLMREGTGSPSPMALMVTQAVGQMIQRKALEADEGGNNSHEGKSTAAATIAAAGSASSNVSAVQSNTQEDPAVDEDDCDGAGACGSHVDTAETEEGKSAKKKKKNKRATKKKHSKINQS